MKVRAATPSVARTIGKRTFPMTSIVGGVSRHVTESMVTEYLARSGAAVADCLIQREGLLHQKWSYDYGVVWRGMEMLHGLTGEERYFRFILDAVDSGRVSEKRIDQSLRRILMTRYRTGARRPDQRETD